MTLRDLRAFVVKNSWAVAPILTVGAICAATSVAGQSQRPTFRDRVDVIRLDVAVVDKNKHPVRGLTAQDFTVLEDDVPARIVDVAPVELPTPEPVTTPWLRDVASDVTRNDLNTKRLIVILFDDAFTGINYSTTSGPFRDPWIGGAGKQIAHAVVDELGPNDMAAVTVAYMGRRQNFTADRAKLHKAIDTFTPQNSPAAGAPLGCILRGGSQWGCVFDAFDHIVAALPEEPPFRKAIVFISQNGGLPAFSAEALALYDAQAETRGGSGTVLYEMGQIFQKLQRSNTSIYAFSPGGLQIVNNGGSDNLKMMAENTGGRAVADTNTPWSGVPAMMAETSAYYLVGVQTVHQDGRFHKVKVRVNRPGVDVRARVGYYAPASTSSESARARKPDASPIDVAMLSGFPTADMAMAAVVVPYARSDSALARVAIVTAVVPQAATAAPMPVELIATAFDKEWKPAGTSRKTVTVSNAVGSYAEIASTLDLAPGRYELRIGAATPDRVGSVFVDLEIPDFAHAPFSTSGLMLLPGGGDARVEPDAPLRPTVRRTFAASDRVHVGWALYQRGADRVVPATVTLTITDDQGRMVSTTDQAIDAAQFGVHRNAMYASLLPLTSLSAGAYLVTLTAEAGSRSESANVRIRIE